jgi:Gas vesicle synthesis protein GvpL/GvpF
MIHVYAIADGLAELPDLRGIGGAELDRVEVEGLDVVFSDVDEDTGVQEEAVLEHAAVVEALMERSDAVLPGRLGPRFADLYGLAAAVTAQAGHLRAALDRVEGCVELGLRVLEPLEPGPGHAPRSGTDYLEARLARRRDAVRRALELHEPLSRLARASTTREGQARGEVLEAAYLLAAEEVDRFRAELGRLEHSERDLAFVVTGPWPPYSFATAEDT